MKLTRADVVTVMRAIDQAEAALANLADPTTGDVAAGQALDEAQTILGHALDQPD